MKKIKLKEILMIWLIILALQSSDASLYYTGDIAIREENVLVEITYENEKAVVDVTAEYLLKNSGNAQETEYDIYAFNQQVDGGKLTFKENEEKTIQISKKTILEPPYSLTLDFNLMLQGKFIGNKAEKGIFAVKFPSKPTITGINPEPSERENLEIKWIKENYVPVTTQRVSWIKDEIDIELKKEITPLKIKEGEIFTVKAIIKNNKAEKYNCKISDAYVMDSFEPVREEEFKKAVPESPIEPSFWIYEKDFILNENEEKTFTYRLRLLDSLGTSEMNLIGFKFFIPEKKFFMTSGRAKLNVEIESTMTVIEECGDGICNENENYGSCPEDCKSGSRDDYCDGIQDGICDPDCRKELDSDCKVEKCGNKICEEGENYVSCPEDCQSGSGDGYCDRIKDEKCDPDCSPEQDPDCKKPDYSLYLIGAIFIILIGGIIFFIYKRGKEY